MSRVGDHCMDHMKQSTLRRLRTTGIVAALALGVGCAPMMTSVRQHPDFASTKRTVRVIAVLPLDVEHYLINFNTSNERDVDKEIEIRAQLSENIKVELEKRGYAVKTDLTAQVSGADGQFSAEYEKLATAYAQASKELYARKSVPVSDSAKFNVSVGSTPGAFVAADGADALFVARYSGFEKSGARVMRDALIGAFIGLGASRATRSSSSSGGKSAPQPLPPRVWASSESAQYGRAIEVALIDGASGEVLWANTYGVTPEDAGAMLAKAMAAFPAADARPKAAEDMTPSVPPGP